MSQKWLATMAVLVIVLVMSLLTASCSKTPDVRLTLCQDMTQILLNSPEELEWKEHKVIMNGHNDLEMKVAYTLSMIDGDVSTHHASCFYAYEQDEIGADTFNEPTAAYSTYPGKMIFENKALDQSSLNQLVNKAMIAQGKQVIVKTQENIKMAQEKAVETYEKVNSEIEKQLEK